MMSPRNEKPNSSFFLLDVRAQASRRLSLGCALLMPNAIWRVTTRIWLIWLVEAIFLRGTNQRVLLRSTKENAVYSSRRGYQCRSAATEHVEALSDRFFTFLWLVSYLCRFRRHFEFHAMRQWARTNSLSRGQVLLQSKVWRGSSLRQRLSETGENWSDIRRKFKFKV